ncbi:MAG: tol-pal system-associated acyl-CoA thioesterase [Gammaproteobacteria bacterium]
MFTWPVRVYYEDTDLGGVVYYANYLRFLERARTEWLRSLGCDQTELLEQHGLLFMITGVEIRYRKPARFNDLLCVTAELARRRRVSMRFAQTIYRDDGQQERLVEASVDAACVEAASLSPRPIPEELLAAMERDR